MKITEITKKLPQVIWFEKEMDQRKLDFLFLGVETGKTSVVCCICIAKRNLKCKTQFCVVLLQNYENMELGFSTNIYNPSKKKKCHIYKRAFQISWDDNGNEIKEGNIYVLKRINVIYIF